MQRMFILINLSFLSSILHNKSINAKLVEFPFRSSLKINLVKIESQLGKIEDKPGKIDLKPGKIDLKPGKIEL